MTAQAQELDKSIQELLSREQQNHEPAREELEFSPLVYVKAALRILNMWKIDRTEQLQLLAIRTGWSATAALLEKGTIKIGDDTLGRCETLLAIFRALIRRRPDQASFAPWIHSPNDALGWHAPIELLRQGAEGFQRVLQMLEGHEKTLSS